MASEMDKHWNPDQIPGYSRQDLEESSEIPEVYHNPDAPPGMYKYETIDKDKVYFPQFDIVFDLSVLKNEDPGDCLSDFIIQTSEDEEEISSEESVVCLPEKEVPQKTKNIEYDASKEEWENISEAQYVEEPGHLYGSYFCQTCNSKMNSEATYIAHINGKKHLKALKAKNVADTAMKSIPQRVDDESRFPAPPPGVYRKTIQEDSLIQEVIRSKLATPCPGLHKVTEIRGITETTYYCHLCDSPCSTNTILPHLGGFKHQLKCLKHFCPTVYDKINFEPKYKIEKEVLGILRRVEKKEGLGKIVVQKEFYGDKTHWRSDRNSDIYQPSTSSAHHSSHSESHSGLIDEDVMDKSKSGYYCKICEAPMNSLAMWNNHVTGKRHMTNMKKGPGTLPSKLKYVKVSNARAVLLSRLKKVKEPIVGLDNIKETQNSDTKTETYQCLLCCSSHTHFDIIDHLLLPKHKKKYLEYIKHPDLDLLEGMNLHDENMNAVIEDISYRAEAEYGRGKPDVFLPRTALF